LAHILIHRDDDSIHNAFRLHPSRWVNASNPDGLILSQTFQGGANGSNRF
jgi:hypothetical protein